jgi:hypothetical protein
MNQLPGKAKAAETKNHLPRRDALKARAQGIVEEPFSAREVSFHLGLTFHRAGANSSSRMREAFTIIYMEREMRLREPKNRKQANDREWWCPGVRVGETIASGLNPVLYEADMNSDSRGVRAKTD